MGQLEYTRLRVCVCVFRNRCANHIPLRASDFIRKDMTYAVPTVADCMRSSEAMQDAQGNSSDGADMKTLVPIDKEPQKVNARSLQRICPHVRISLTVGHECMSDALVLSMIAHSRISVRATEDVTLACDILPERLAVASVSHAENKVIALEKPHLMKHEHLVVML